MSDRLANLYACPDCGGALEFSHKDDGGDRWMECQSCLVDWSVHELEQRSLAGVHTCEGGPACRECRGAVDHDTPANLCEHDGCTEVATYLGKWCDLHGPGRESSFPSCEVCGVTLHDGDGRIGKEHPTCWPTCPEQQLATPDETGAITLRMDETEVRVDGSSRIQMSQQEALAAGERAATKRIAALIDDLERRRALTKGSNTWIDLADVRAILATLPEGEFEA